MSSNISAFQQQPFNSGPESPLERARVLKPSFRLLLRNWWPVLAWLGVLRIESTDFASSAHTSGLLYAVLLHLVPQVTRQIVQELNAVLRKSGHFVGYGILGVLVFYALRNTNRDRLKQLMMRRWGFYLRDFWRSEWAALSVLVAIIAASLDEIHQSFIPSRTGVWQDVVLDTCGAVLLQVVIYVVSVRHLNRRRSADQPEFSSAP